MVQEAGLVAHDPNALYAAAIGALHLSPAVASMLSPIGASLFTEVYRDAVTAGGEAVTTIGSAAIDDAIELVGPEVVAEVADVAGAVAAGVGSAIPVVNVFVSILQILDALPKATGSDTTAVDCISFWSAEPGSSGPADPVTGNTATTPSDIFASSEAAFEPILTNDGYRAPTAGEPHILSMRQPNSALGACLAAMTETQSTDPDAAIDDGGFHSPAGLHVLTSFYKLLFPLEVSVGVSADSRVVYHALRMAMASNGPDHGVIPYAFYMDLLAADLDAGHLTVGYIAFLLSNWFDETTSTIKPSRCAGPAAQGMASQIVALIQSWKETRAGIHMPRFPGLHPSALSNAFGKLAGLANPGLSDAQRAAAETKAIAAGASAIDVALASPAHGFQSGWSKEFSLSPAASVAILLPRLRAALAHPKLALSPETLSTIAHALQPK